MLVGFFLSIGMQGLPTPTIILVSLFLCALLPFKTFFYYLLLEFFGLRARTSFFCISQFSDLFRIRLDCGGFKCHEGVTACGLAHHHGNLCEF